MLKKTIVLILAACILFCTASFAQAESEEKQAPADKIVYENEYLTVRMGSIAVEEDSVTIPLSFDATGQRSCIMTADMTEAMFTDMDGFEALKNLKQINGGITVPNADPGETIECALPGIPPDPMITPSSWISLNNWALYWNPKRSNWNRKAFRRI